MLAPPGQSCGMLVQPCDQVFCNGPLYCGCPVQSQSPWNPQRGSATAGAAVTIAPAANTAAAAVKSARRIMRDVTRAYRHLIGA
jgi:hypothetical protein